ncbi:MAG: BrnA antitoxin family protein [Acidobacteria bacterium]|nr:BrnA antitoxin family protein [Acidobacteriota bacterium]
MKKIPRLANKDAGREFRARHDSSEYTDRSKANRAVAPKLKPSLKAISLRLRVSMIEELKLLANRRNVPYQSLLKIFLAERIQKELHGAPEAE